MIAMVSMMMARAWADPCGMVPPIWTGTGAEPPGIERQGLQQTYVFFRDGVQTIAIRPGFSGSVEQFGMLVPLPAVPALRKIDDRTFDHLRSAVDPPLVRVHVQDSSWFGLGRAGTAATKMQVASPAMEMARDDVRVVKEEAVGMYEVAVLQAGSSRALQRWMDQNRFRYPTGMDATVEEYVAARWMFVAVKARVGAMSDVAARPGMRSAPHGLPSGSSFDGYVQGMAFRFAVDRPVVPMRLAVFNGEDTHNRVYVLAEGPARIREIPQALVRRQVTGAQLLRNLTEPLPYVVSGGRLQDAAELPQVAQARDPEPHVAAARDLMVADLLAAATGELSLPFEEREKELLRINEALGLRDASIDALVHHDVAASRADAVGPTLRQLPKLSLTVVDGVFPPQVLREQNLTLAVWEMPPSQNRLEVWTDRKPPLDVLVYR